MAPPFAGSPPWNRAADVAGVSADGSHARFRKRVIRIGAVSRVTTNGRSHDFEDGTIMQCNSGARHRPVLKPLVLALGLCMGATNAEAALRIEVTTTQDTTDAGFCSLRQAIAAMNVQAVTGSGCTTSTISGSSDVIAFDATAFPPGGANTITLADIPSGTLVITDASLAVDASANGNVVIERARPSSDNANAFGIFRDSSITGSLTLSHLTIRNGRVSVPASGNYATGGGVSCSCAHLAVINSTISDNLVTANLGSGGLATGYGGGLYVLGGTLEVTRSVISGNSANAAGGGIAVYAGSAVLDHATVSGNRAENGVGSARGGGIYTRPGDFTATNSVVSANYAQRYGGGMLVGGTLTLVGSTVDGNSASNDGGGMKVLGGGTLTNSTVSGNTAFRGAGIYDGAGYHVPMHPLNLIGSTVSGNHAAGTSGPRGGGIYSRYGGLYLTNSTLASNTSDFYGGGIFVLTNTAPIALKQVTVAANTAAERGGGMMIATSDAGSVTFDATAFANAGISNSGGENIAVTTGGTTIAGTGNLVFDGHLINVSFSNAPASGDPLLGPLQDNGGATFTMSPAAGSAAIDGYAPTAGQCAAPTDQRGVRRPQGIGCDIGAVERVLDRIFADNFDGFAVPD